MSFSQELIAEFFASNIHTLNEIGIRYSYRCEACDDTYELPWSAVELNKKMRISSKKSGVWIFPEIIYDHIIEKHDDYATILILDEEFHGRR